MTMSIRSVKVAVLGCGVVGSAVIRQLITNNDLLSSRAGARLELIGVAVRRPHAERNVEMPPGLLTGDARVLVEQDDVDVVIELVGGIEPARSFVATALSRGTSVVTANKALIAEHGPHLHAMAAGSGVELCYEAAVAGAVPLLRPLRESLSGDEVHRVIGIINGTSNYILDSMATTGCDFESALRSATELGFAEADPTADVDGFDAAAKAAIVARLAFHASISPDDVYREGIRGVTAEDIRNAQACGHVVKLLAICDHRASDNSVNVRVHPAMVPVAHPLAQVRGADNGVFVESASAGRLMFTGAGAGGSPTASAVLGDLVMAVRARLAGTKSTVAPALAAVPVQRMGVLATRHHLDIIATDPQAAVRDLVPVLHKHCVPVDSIQVRPAPATGVVVLTGEASDEALATVVKTVADLPTVDRVSSMRFLHRGSWQ
jgi:homoserine dehydrogenase